MQPPIEKSINNPAKYIVELATTILPLQKYGFAESYISSNSDIVVLASDKCKIKIIWGGWDYLAGYTIAIYFGRTYAVDDSMNMTVNGELYRC
jgi:hypothetical protein